MYVYMYVCFHCYYYHYYYYYCYYYDCFVEVAPVSLFQDSATSSSPEDHTASVSVPRYWWGQPGVEAEAVAQVEAQVEAKQVAEAEVEAALEVEVHQQFQVHQTQPIVVAKVA